MVSTAYPLIPIIGTIASDLNVLTIATGIRQTWNFGMHLISLWLFLLNSLRGVEAIVWHGATGIKAPVWCDICMLLSIYTLNAMLSTNDYQQRADLILQLQLASRLAHW